METEVEQPWDVIVIGGGPAGYFAAIRCAEIAQEAGRPVRVLIVERARRPLGKVIISGGERCNVTHACFEPAKLVSYYPRGAAALRGPFSRFQPRDTVDWFAKRGVVLKTEADGRMFPITNHSKTIVDCLEEAARQAGVVVWTQTGLLDCQRIPEAADQSPRFRIQLRRDVLDCEQVHSARSVLFASGSESFCHSLIARLGHTIEPPVPSLFTFKITDTRLADLAGLSVPNASLRLLADSASEKVSIPPQQGPLLITHWGLSGPATLKLSAWGARWLFECNYQAGLLVNWLHPLSTEKVLEELQSYRILPENNRKKPGAHALFAQIPIRLWKRLTEAAGISETQNWADVSKIAQRRLAEELTAGCYAIEGKGIFKDEFVTCGGVNLDEVNFKTMQSRLVPGLFFAGEVLDIDGLTGGFNFQNAWTTGWLAGEALGA
ncbi:MAG: NAD(P)/FAD-dependent oxidoreductase [Chloroflexi bacterium]|nr:NAD(P)/FAD-dependent oxidoreductase [Chloroflexota bacterium]